MQERFAIALFEVAIHSSLGGQHGEEGKGQDEVSGEEAGGEEDRQKENGEEEVKGSLISAQRAPAWQALRRAIDGVEERPASSRRQRHRRFKSTTEGVGEVEVHPSRSLAVSADLQVGLMLTLSGAPFSYVHVNPLRGEYKQPDYLAKNRFGQAPCLAVGRLNLCQSAAILEYLADALGKFSSRSAEESARIRKWLFWDFDSSRPPIIVRAIKRGSRQGTSAIAEFSAPGHPPRRVAPQVGYSRLA